MKFKGLILLLIFIMLLTGCGKIQKNQGAKFEKKELVPKELGELNKGLQEILKDTITIEEKTDGTYIEEKPEEKPVTVEELWNKINNKIKDQHEEWNKYQGEEEKKKITQDKADRLSESLNLLTKAIEEKNIKDIYKYGSLSMFNLSSIYDLYKDEIKGEINRLKFYTYQSYLLVLEGKTEEARIILQSYEEEINKIRLKIKNDEEKIKQLDKVDISIVEMGKSLKENSLKLIRIKRDVVIKNLEELGK